MNRVKNIRNKDMGVRKDIIAGGLPRVVSVSRSYKI